MTPTFEKIPKHDPNSREGTDQLLKLEQILVKLMPQSAHLLVLCRLVRRANFSSWIDIQFFRYTSSSAEDRWDTDDEMEHFFVCVERPNFHTKTGIILLAPPTVTPEMVQALDQLIDWSESQIFHSVQRSLWSHLEILLTQHRNQKSENNVCVPGVMYAMLNEEKVKNLKVDVPSSLYVVRCLNNDNVDEVVKNWKWRVSHSEEVIRKGVNVLPSCGLFLQAKAGTSDCDEEMVSSVLLSPLGTFNILYTPENHRKRGYAKMVMEWIAKETASQLGTPLLAEAETCNISSRELLQKVGYVEIFNTKWFYFEPPFTQ